jgi:hypothetical protein
MIQGHLDQKSEHFRFYASTGKKQLHETSRTSLGNVTKQLDGCPWVPI